ncbi:hypothetical protein ACWDQO_30315 [Streptomyces sp. NPDC003703]|uniref:hypothetical protein n=1 Tax=Streptomyces sp. NPDC003283 TaxID=3364681 RepID=UPI0036A16898
MNDHDILQEPPEHLRFAAYLVELRQVADADEISLVSRVLTDPDRTMARSAVLRHLDDRAEVLHLRSAYEAWAEALTRAVSGHPLLTRRLREWSLFRAVVLELPWHPDALLAASDWLQLRTAAGPGSRAAEILAVGGRTRRIRNTAAATLKQQSRA